MMTRVRSTSLHIYFTEIKPDLGKRQNQVLKVIALNPQGLTNSEIADRLNWPINTVTPRVYELRKDFGVVKEKERRECSVTGRRAITWVMDNG